MRLAVIALLSLTLLKSVSATAPVFEHNQGQAAAGVRFLSRSRGHTLLIGDREAVWRGGDELTLSFVGEIPARRSMDSGTPSEWRVSRTPASAEGI